MNKDVKTMNAEEIMPLVDKAFPMHFHFTGRISDTVKLEMYGYNAHQQSLYADGTCEWVIGKTESPKFTYLSSAYSADPETAKILFKYAKKWVEETYLEPVWSPIDHIPETSTWQQSMDICKDVFNKNLVNKIYVFITNDTFRSSGVKKELDWAKEYKVPVHFIICFGNKDTGFSFHKVSN